MWIYRGGTAGQRHVQDWCLNRLGCWSVTHRRERVRDPYPWEHRTAHLVVAGRQGRSTLVVSPTERASSRLLCRLAGPGSEPDPSLVEWLRLVGSRTAMSTTPPPSLEPAR